VRGFFRDTYGAPPTAVAVAPGRINLIGEHTDYNGGLALPAAIDRYVAVAVRPRRDPVVDLASDRFASRFQAPALPASKSGSWSDYAVGVAVELRERVGERGGFEAAITSDLPVGGGLSSSGALEAAIAVALLAAWGADLPGLEIARLCQRAENVFVGARTGIMDQITALFARAGNALFLDCRSLTWESRPLPDLKETWLLADTRVRHELAFTAYNDRREECDRAATALGLACLREATEIDLERLEDPVLRRRVRHVVRENARVVQAAQALQRRDPLALGPLLNASHTSLRDDYEVSCLELDGLVTLANGHPSAIGARMMGGGFGGCVLILAEVEGIDDLEDHLRRGYLAQFHATPELYRVRSVDGVLGADLR
jgi:galactokinase